MMKTTEIILLALLPALAFTSCVKDDLYNTPHPDRGAILLTTDWSRRGEAVPVPDSYTVEVAGLVHPAKARRLPARNLRAGQHGIAGL